MTRRAEAGRRGGGNEGKLEEECVGGESVRAQRECPQFIGVNPPAGFLV